MSASTNGLSIEALSAQHAAVLPRREEMLLDFGSFQALNNVSAQLLNNVTVANVSVLPVAVPVTVAPVVVAPISLVP